MTEIKLDVQQTKILRENFLLELKMACKIQVEKVKNINWTTTEINLFVEALTNEEFRFGECLKSKKCILRNLKVSTARLTEEKFIERNQRWLRNACFRHNEVTNQIQHIKKDVEGNDRLP